jgi:MoaA/NifB/PqqE/SkfB family radical SAM enzyme
MNYPEILKIEITNHCNANCVFCNNDKIKNKQNMPLWMFKKILKSFPTARQVQPQWFGEPMLHPDFDKIIDICKKYNKEVVFYTNGSLIDKHLPSLKKLNKADRIIISLEGSDKEIYERIRRGLSWEKLLFNIDLIKTIPAIKILE